MHFETYLLDIFHHNDDGERERERNLFLKGKELMVMVILFFFYMYFVNTCGYSWSSNWRAM